MRVLYLWFEHLAADLWARKLDGSPQVLTELSKSTQRLAALSSEAKAAGLFIGQPLADARVMFPGLRAGPLDRPVVERGLMGLARVCQQFSPLVALDGEDALVLDIRGLPRLYGGEPALMETVVGSLTDLGLSVRSSIADTKGAAWALAHYGQQGVIAPSGGAESVLAAFPVEALRLTPDTAQALHRLGIKTIGALTRLPRDQLTRRYGREVLDRLEQAMGRHGEPLDTLPHKQPFSARLRFAQPLGLIDDLMMAAERLIDHLVTRLTAEQLGLTRLRIEAEATDGHAKIKELGFAQPTRDATLILKLIEPKLETLESEFGFDSLRLAAATTAPQPNAQDTLVKDEDAQAEALLLANLGNRFGFDRLQRLLPQPTHLPDYEILPRPVLSIKKIEQAKRTLSPRPALKLPMPEPLEVLEAGIPPKRFKWRRQVRQLYSATGPERVTPPWWRSARGWDGTRDYWSVQTVEGPRLWLFHNKGQDRWFVAGDMG